MVSLAVSAILSALFALIIFFTFDRLVLRKRFLKNISELLIKLTDTMIWLDFPFSLIQEYQLTILEHFTQKMSVSDAISVSRILDQVNMRENVVVHSKKQKYEIKMHDQFVKELNDIIDMYPRLKSLPSIKDMKKNYDELQYISEKEIPKSLPDFSDLTPLYESITSSMQKPTQKKENQKDKEVTKKAPTKKKKKEEKEFEPIHQSSKELDLS